MLPLPIRKVDHSSRLSVAKFMPLHPTSSGGSLESTYELFDARYTDGFLSDNESPALESWFQYLKALYVMKSRQSFRRDAVYSIVMHTVSISPDQSNRFSSSTK